VAPPAGLHPVGRGEPALHGSGSLAAVIKAPNWRYNAGMRDRA